MKRKEISGEFNFGVPDPEILIQEVQSKTQLIFNPLFHGILLKGVADHSILKCRDELIGEKKSHRKQRSQSQHLKKRAGPCIRGRKTGKEVMGKWPIFHSDGEAVNT